MPCPHCGSPEIQEHAKRTSLGYRTFRCPACTRRCNERSGTPFNDLSVPTDIVFLVVLWRLRYPLRLRHLAEMFLERGFTFSHETVRTWEALVAPPLTEQLRARRKGQGRPEMACGRDVHQRTRHLVLPLSGHRRRREPGRLAAQRAPGHGCGQAILRPVARGGRACAREGDHRRARRLSARRPRDPGPGRDPPPAASI